LQAGLEVPAGHPKEPQQGDPLEKPSGHAKWACRVRIWSVHGLLAGRVLAKKVGSGQKNLVTLH